MRVLIELVFLAPFLAFEPVAGYDPEEDMNAVDSSGNILHFLLKSRMEYPVTTSDGYILRIQRIPYGKSGPGQGKRPVIFMQHGIECSSTNWITNLPNESAAFIFADAGFDVWLGNVRGNTYGMNNIYLSNKDHEFWEFSWDEMAKFDMEATINFALQTSGQSQLYYMAHSQGTMTGFAKFSTDPDFGKKIIKFFALAPVATVKHIGGALSYIAPFTKEIQFFTWIVGIDEFFPNNWFMDLLAKYVCGFAPTNKLLCQNIMFLICGPSDHQLNESRVPVFVSHTPAGTSTQDVVHFGQGVLSGLFQMYDYGSAKANTAKYGVPVPPVYNISKMEVPTALFWGSSDILADPTDVKNTIIPGVKNMVANCELEGYNHLDFIWGLRAAPDIYLKIVDHILHGTPLC